jgi:hypothetical protein
MPRVSILLPAFRPAFLDACVASALAQTCGDFELLIGDDCPDGSVAGVLAKWSDPRIRYLPNPNRGVPASNRDMLLGHAVGEYIKFLFDDDLLLPRCLEVMCAIADAAEAQLVFAAAYQIDPVGLTREPTGALAPDGAAIVDRDSLFRHALAPAYNFLGGPVNTLIAAAALSDLTAPFGLEGNRMRFLTDVALYANFADAGHRIIGTGARLSAVRVHGGQTSHPDSPVFAAGVYEWEYLTRWAADRWPVAPAATIAALESQHRWFATHLPRHPRLGEFIALGSAPDSAGAFLHPAFRALLADAWREIDAAGRLTPAQAGVSSAS